MKTNMQMTIVHHNALGFVFLTDNLGYITIICNLLYTQELGMNISSSFLVSTYNKQQYADIIVLNNSHARKYKDCILYLLSLKDYIFHRQRVRSISLRHQ